MISAISVKDRLKNLIPNYIFYSEKVWYVHTFYDE